MNQQLLTLNHSPANKTSMPFRFKDLEVWKIAIRSSNKIDKIAKEFLKIALFGLASQLKRTADSAVLNIAEGSTGQTKPEFQRFLNYSLCSSIEVVSCFIYSGTRLYITLERFQELYFRYEILCRMNTKLRNSLKNENSRP